MQRASTIRLRTSLFQEAAEIVDREYASDLSLDVIARRVASSRRQLQRAYAEIGQTTFRDHLTRVRMQKAAEMLATRALTVSGGSVGRAQAVGAPGTGAPVGTEIRRRHALIAAERLGELGGLAVADPVRDFPDRERARGQHLGCLLHTHPGQVVAERGLPDLRVCTLELPAR